MTTREQQQLWEQIAQGNPIRLRGGQVELTLRRVHGQWGRPGALPTPPTKRDGELRHALITVLRADALALAAPRSFPLVWDLDQARRFAAELAETMSLPVQRAVLRAARAHAQGEFSDDDLRQVWIAERLEHRLIGAELIGQERIRALLSARFGPPPIDGVLDPTATIHQLRGLALYAAGPEPAAQIVKVATGPAVFLNARRALSEVLDRLFGYWLPAAETPFRPGGSGRGDVDHP